MLRHCRNTMVMVAALVAFGAFCSYLSAQQLDTRATPQPTVESLDQLAAKLRPAADRAIAEVSRCEQKGTEKEALDCIALAEDTVIQYLAIEKQMHGLGPWRLSTRRSWPRLSRA